MLETRLPAVAALAGMAAALGCVSAAAAAAPLTWSEPHLIARQAPFSNVPSAGVTCPSTALCLVNDAGGDIEVVGDPSGTISRSVFALPGIHSLEALTCPATTLCVSADADGHVVTSTNPTAGPAAWAITTLPGGRRLAQITCPSASVCVALDDQSNIVTTVDPPAGADAWTTTVMPSPIAAASCASTTFCAAVQADGRVLTSANPTGGVAAWFQSGATGVPATALACPDPSFCVAGSAAGSLMSAIGPVSATLWAAVGVDGTHRITSLACPSTTLCIAGDDGGDVVTSTNPTGGIGGLAVQTLGGAGVISSIACPSVSVCVAADGAYRLLVSASPAAGAWTALAFPGYDAFTSLACSPASSSASSCVAVDGFGDHFASSSRPAGAWKVVSVTRGLGKDPEVWRVACASGTLCLALVTHMGPPGASGAGGTLYAFNPIGGAHAFRRLEIPGVERSIGFEEVSCVQGPRCAAVDFGGHVFSSRTPARARSWTPNRSARRWFAVSCPATSLCVALHSDPDRVVSSGEPPMYATSSRAGSIDVRTGHSRRTFAIDPVGGLTGIACPSKSMCVAVDDGGNVLSTSRPTAGPGAWTMAHVDDWPLAGVVCPTTALCVAVDRAGRAIVGRRY